jgi:hypothetical protein
LLGEGVVVERQPAADVRQAVLLGRHRHAVRERGHLADDVGDRAVSLARLAELDEPGVLGEATGIEEERNAVAIADLSHGPQVCQRHGLAAARVVRDRDEHDRDVHALAEQGVERVDVHVALERVLGGRIGALGDDQIHGLGAGELDVRPGRVEVGVVGNDLARPAQDREQDLLGRPALVCRDHVAEREQRLDTLEEGVPRGRSGVALVAVLDRGPLIARHRARARIGQEVDEDVAGVEVEEVPAGGPERRLACLDRGQPDGLDRVDPERLDDRPEAVHRRRIGNLSGERSLALRGLSRDASRPRRP